MAGYSGGRKLITPGIAHGDTIAHFHNARMLTNPCASNCVLVNNPLHEAQREVLRMLGHVLAVNVVIDEDRKIAFLNFGETLASHEKAVQFLDSHCKAPVKKRFSVVVTSGAGYPLDKTYYQTVKSIVSAAEILVTGGDLFVVSECSEGFGSVEFLRSQERLLALGIDRFMQEARNKTRADIDEWQTVMLVRALGIGRIHLFASGLSRQEEAATGILSTASLEADIEKCLARTAHASLAAIPEGPYVVPILEGDPTSL